MSWDAVLSGLICDGDEVDVLGPCISEINLSEARIRQSCYNILYS